MASRKKHKKRKYSGPTENTAARIDRALQENRTQQALDLAKTLHKREPTEQNKELLRRATLARGQDLAARGQYRDAATVLCNAAQYSNESAFLSQIAHELCKCGELVKAREFRQRITDPESQNRISFFIADEAVRLGAAGRVHVAEEWRDSFDQLLQAFTHAEKGEDDQARAKLGGIGLRSPFLEWKLLLRGLLAYYQNDDDRAAENWQRLDPERWPFRLASPLRFTIDGDFVRNQSASAQEILQKQADRLIARVQSSELRRLQADINKEGGLHRAYQLAEKLTFQWREHPKLIERLATCFYWAIIHHGGPQDLRRHRKVFAPPADDPIFARLEALATENRGEFDTAHEYWQDFEKSVITNSAWPEAHKNRIRALIWMRMGENAGECQALDFDDEFAPPFFLDNPGKPSPLNPDAATCFEKSLKLSPDHLETYEALFQHYRDKQDTKKAEKTGWRLLEHFPKHAHGLEKLADLLMETNQYVKALELFEKAVQVNPLEQRLRVKLANAYSYVGREYAEQGKFDKARDAYQTALSMWRRDRQYPLLCKWAACEYKAGDSERGDELLQQAQSEQGTRLAVIFSFLIETIRFKLTKLKPRINKEFNALLAEPPTGAAAAALAATSAEHRAAGVNYYGQQTHEKKVTAYLQKAQKAIFTEPELLATCASLALLRKRNLVLEYLALGQRRFPASPHFYLLDAQLELDNGVYRARMWILIPKIKKAKKLIEAMPRCDEQQMLLKQVQECETAALRLNPMGAFFDGMFDDSPFGDDDDYDDDDNDDDDEYYF